MSTETDTSTVTAAKAGKYLTFGLGHESYGVPVLKVREIIRLCNITPVPNMPRYIKGVVNLRGKIVPVVDLRLKFQLAKIEDHERTCIVVVDVRLSTGLSSAMGLIVDVVEEVVNVPQSDIEPTPDFGLALDTEFVLGMAKVKGAVKSLLDIDKVVASDTLQAVVARVAPAKTP